MRRLPETLPDDGLLVGYSLEASWRPEVFGFPRMLDPKLSPSSTLEPILDASEGHLITVAPTGAGKGTGCIIPALLRYPGPVVVIDPKGENYAVTAKHRRKLGQEVILLDPFEAVPVPAERHAFNPLDMADPASPSFIEDLTTLAYLAATNQGDRRNMQDPFWPQMGRTLVTAMLLDVMTMPDSREATLPAARDLLNQPMDELIERTEKWHEAENPELRRTVSLFNASSSTTFGGIYMLAVNHLDFLKGQQVVKHLRSSDLDLNKVLAGAPQSIYLVLPPDRLESHAPLLRLWIGILIGVISRRSSPPEHPTLFLVDEAAQLGELSQLRQAITLLRGYGVRVWSFWQDLAQLKQLYPDDWKSILNNCATQQYFGATTALSADAVLEAAAFGSRETIMSLERDEMILNLVGDEPVIARKPNYRHDPAFKGRFDPNPYYRARRDDDARTRAVFRRTRAPAERQRDNRLRQRFILAEGLFHPLGPTGWRTLPRKDLERRVKDLNLDPRRFRRGRSKLRRYKLACYASYDLYELSDTSVRPTRCAYFLAGRGSTPLTLDGSTRPIHALNERVRLKLTPTTVIDYLVLFSAAINSDEGRFLILDDVSELQWRQKPDESVLEDLGKEIRPPRVVGSDNSGGFHVEAEVLYGTALSRCRFHIGADGTVEMEEDDTLEASLDVISDKARLAYIGEFDGGGQFVSVREERDEG